MLIQPDMFIKITGNFNVFTFHRTLTSFWNVFVLRPSFLQKNNDITNIMLVIAN